MTISRRNGLRAALAAAMLVTGAACKDQGSGGQGQRQSGSSGSALQGGSSDQGSAMKQTQQPQQKGETAQQQASKAQASSSTQRTVQGRIVRAGQDEIVLRQGTGEPDLRLKVGPETSVTMGGQQRSVGDLQEGTQVRASYDESKGAPQATKIEALGQK